MMLAHRANQIAGSRTSGMRNKAEALRAQGKEIINFAAGELDLPPAERLRAALRDSAGADVHRYTDTSGLPELRQALADRVSRLCGIRYTEHELLLTTGAKHALYLACLVLINPGDEVLIPSPGWGTFTAQVRLAGGTPVPVPTQDTDFTPTVSELAARRTPRTRMLILNTPNNPTGAVYPPQVLAAITEWAVRSGIWILFDECYGELVLPGVEHAHPVALIPQARDQVIGIGSFSKSFAVTGWRAGHAYGPAPVIAAMRRLQSHTTSNVTSVVQHALLPAACGELDGFVAEVRQILQRRHRLVEEALTTVPYVSTRTPQGAFYFFLDCRDVLGRKLRGTAVPDDDTLAELLLTHHQLALTPGSAFGGPGFLRLSYAIAEDRIREGLARLRDAMSHVE